MQKVVLITGVASGIGRYIAEQYVAAKYEVIGIDVSANSATDYRYYQANLLSESDTQQIFANIDRIDFAVNCAGVQSIRKKLVEFSSEEVLNGWSMNFLATFNALKYEIQNMQRHGGGKIVNIASIVGNIGMNNTLVYGGAKASIINMTKVAAIEYAKDNILVNSISPATIDTPMIRKKYNGQLRDYSQVYHTKNCGDVDDVYTVVKMLEQNNFMTGNDIILDGGLTSLFYI